MAARRGRGEVATPRAHVVSEQWPTATLDGDHAAGVAQHVAATVGAALRERGWSINELARRSGVNRQAIANLLAGATWAELRTIARLEASLGVALWPRDVAE